MSPLGRVAILLLLSLASGNACGASAEERERAAATERHARAVRLWQEVFDRRTRNITSRCSETPDQLSRLFTRDSTLTVQMNGKTQPIFPFLSAVARATVHHDSTKSCARSIDSVAALLRLENARSGRR
jgi:hypothetical protein